MSEEGFGIGMRDLMGSVGALPDADQARRGGGAPVGLGLNAGGSVAPASHTQGNPQWWNPPDEERPAPKPKKAKAKAASKPHKSDSSKSTSKSSSSSAPPEVPLVNLDAPSPIIWITGLACLMTLTMVCEIIQMHGLADMGVNPMFGPDESTMLQMGAKFGPLIVEGEWYRLFAASFLQNGVILYLLSMVFLFVARNLERESGFWRVSLVFLVTSTYGIILSCVFVPELISCGTSGAVFGYLGMMLSDLLSSWRAQKKRWLKLIAMVALIAVLLVLGLTPFVDNFMHVGGLLMGFLAALMLLPNLNFGRCEGIVHTVLALVAFPLMSIIFMISLVVFFRRVDTDTSWCPWCMKATCVNINDWCAPYIKE
jgi:membrane associated rhomboid family serine protease